MNPIRVVDARMGRGKSTAAINYINAHKKDTRFLYATPFLSEVDRFHVQCGMHAPPGGPDHAKMPELRNLVEAGKNICTTHALFEDIDDELLEIIKGKQYTLIIDEAFGALDKADITEKDREILDRITETDDNGVITWIDDEYSGKFDGYKKMADRHTLYRMDAALVEVFNPNLLRAFEDVFLLTYLFTGSVLEAYFRCFDLPYEIWGVGYITDDGQSPVVLPSVPGRIHVAGTQDTDIIFIPGADRSPPIDFRPLINIVDKAQMNSLGDKYHAMAKNWYLRRAYNNPEMLQMRKNMQNFFKNITKSSKKDRMWTCFKDQSYKLIPSDGRYESNFVQMMSRATNEYADCCNIAYMVNRFEDPNLLKFLYDHGYAADRDQCALSDMLQFIWRSAIRNGKPINLYIPSKRMRDLLTDWMDRTAAGEQNPFQLLQEGINESWITT